ncbi:hypothetical protein IJH01_02035 [Candidatus Saccharibacteria bacterium]|nr:hypothetical protein [Candidatus Saccharibacteria bacterium]
MKNAYLSLIKEIRDAVREKAQEIPKFKESGNGAIRILAYPLCREADEWLGGLSAFGSNPADKNDIVDYEYTFAITPGGRRVITGKWDDDTELQTVDCYAYSALKIAHCSRVQDEGAGLSSGIDLKIPHLTEDYGYADHPGAVCMEIYRRKADPLMDTTEPDGNLEQFCLIYVCVSGADSLDDEKCALSSVRTVCNFFADETYKHFVVKAPSVSGEVVKSEPGVKMLSENELSEALSRCFGKGVYRLHFERSAIVPDPKDPTDTVLSYKTLELDVEA